MHDRQLQAAESSGARDFTDAAVIAYSGSSVIVCGESHLTSNFNATTTWVRRDGKWLVQMHTEIPIKPQPVQRGAATNGRE
jgi:hypothetical protein